MNYKPIGTVTRHGLILLLIACPRIWPADLASLSSIYVPKLEHQLKNNIASFWYPKCIDRQHGGYIISFGPRGELKAGGTKMIVTQARMVWLFSRLAQAGYETKTYLQAADWGYRFLKEKMWDGKNGGFYWEVDSTGNQKLKPRKHLYGQAFALYALSEYYLTSHQREVLDFALAFFHLLESKAHDPLRGGYVEFFNEDWSTLPSSETSYMGDRSDVKLMNTHLHLLEAMTAFYRASKLPLARERLLELITIESNTVVRKPLGACTDKYGLTWEPKLDGDYARVSYGHDIENVWLLIDACKAANVSNYLLLDLYKGLFDYASKYGYDKEKGGFFDSGFFLKAADKRNKTWWVQAEAIVSALYMYKLTQDQKYLEIFEQTYKFIERYQTDWEHGEWHALVTPEGKGEGDKAHSWKAGYHNGRAMLECLALLRP